jgi:uncharacterized protein (DUF2384 family)
MNENSEKQIHGDKARRRVVAAAVREIRRREGLLPKLEQLDESVIIAALNTFESAGGAAEWLVCPAFGLGGSIPAKVAGTKEGRQRVLRVLGCIEHGVFL